MATCNWCGQEMTDPAVRSCSDNVTVDFPDGESLAPSTSHMNEPSGRCHDCGIVHGGIHHPGCDAERCPRCGGQLISCECLTPIVKAADAMGLGGEMKVVQIPDEGKLDLEGVPDDMHVLVNGKPSFEGDDVCAGDVIKLVRQTPRSFRQTPPPAPQAVRVGPFVRFVRPGYQPARWRVWCASVVARIAWWAIRFSHKGRL